MALSALLEDAPISELASQYGVHSTIIHRWKREALVAMEAGFSGKREKSHFDQEAHIHELHAKIGQLSMERDFLVDASKRLGFGGGKKW